MTLAQLKQRIDALERVASRLAWNSPEWLAAHERLDALRDEYEDRL